MICIFIIPPLTTKEHLPIYDTDNNIEHFYRQTSGSPKYKNNRDTQPLYNSNNITMSVPTSGDVPN